jgi:hypothetical protein
LVMGDAADEQFAARMPHPSKINPRSGDSMASRGQETPATGSPAADASGGGRTGGLELDGPG